MLMLINFRGKVRISTTLIIIIFLHYLFYFINLFDRNVIFLLIYFILGILAIIIYCIWNIRENHNRKNKRELILIGSIILFPLSSLIIIFSLATPQNSSLLDIYYYLYGLLSFFCAYYMAAYIKNVYRGIFFFYWLITIVIAIFFIKNGLGNPNAYDIIFDKASRNYVSMIYIKILIFLHLSYYREGNLLPIKYSIIVFLGCLILFGRTGIAISIAILLFSVVQTIFNRKVSNYNRMIWFGILSITLFTFLTYYHIIIDFFNSYTSFASGTESIRSLVVEEYLNAIIKDMKKILFSVELNKCCYITAQLDFNTHNSFILGHVRYGIIHIILSLLIYFYILKSKNVTFIFFATLIYFRYWFDQVGLFSPVDVVLFYIVTSIYFQKRRISYS